MATTDEASVQIIKPVGHRSLQQCSSTKLQAGPNGNQSFAATAGLSREASAPTSELVGGVGEEVPRELAHGNQSFAATAGLSRAFGSLFLRF